MEWLALGALALTGFGVGRRLGWQDPRTIWTGFALVTVGGLGTVVLAECLTHR